MLLTDEIGGEVYSVGEVRLHKPVITVRELIGVRVAAIADYTINMPNDKAAAPGKKPRWEKFSKEMTDLSKQLTEEAAKGSSADQKKLATLLKRMDANCTNCHNDFRDD